ncbi:M16 family metallopeptidase [Falsirhodobacter deserti]|uniref:M16 family metallopeptidase n=1 Tax=Falsirhodobacter deserti TaxID=1365611 RepID=UPI000FE3D414|nr:pitrilysin family protein [Falsirhodobacter deserti]
MKILRYAAAVICLALPAHAAVDIQKVTSPGGITAWLVEEHAIPFTALELRFLGGTSLDPEGKRGAVNLMAATLEEGAGDLDAQGFAAARDRLAARFGFSSDADAVSVSAQFLTENRDEAVDLLRQAIIQPRFDDSAIARVRGQVLSGIAADAQDPDAIANRTFSSDVFGNHPYGSDASGTAESVSALTRDDLVAAHKATMAQDNIYVAAAGDITPTELGTLLDRLLGDLPAKAAEGPGDADWQADGDTHVVDFPTPQSVVQFGQPAPAVDDPDFMAAFTLNEIVGGGRFTARLMDELRTKRGLTYGAYSQLASMEHGSFLAGRFASDNANVGEAVSLVREQWEKLAQDGVTQQELDAAKTYLTGAYPLRFDGNGPIASILVSMQMQGFPVDYPQKRNEMIEALTLEDVNRVARELYDPEALHFVVVGQPKGLEN